MHRIVHNCFPSFISCCYSHINERHNYLTRIATNHNVTTTSSKKSLTRRSIWYTGPLWYAENFQGGGFIQWLVVVICIWWALFVTSEFEVITIFPNQRFGEVCWHKMHAPLRHAFPLNINYQRSKLDIGGK